MTKNPILYFVIVSIMIYRIIYWIMSLNIDGKKLVEAKPNIMEELESKTLTMAIAVLLLPIIAWFFIKLAKGGLNLLINRFCFSWDSKASDLAIRKACKDSEDRIIKVEANIETINRNLGILLERIANIEINVKNALDEVVSKKREKSVSNIMESMKNQVCDGTKNAKVKENKINSGKNNLKEILEKILEEPPLKSHPRLSTVGIKYLKEAFNKIQGLAESMKKTQKSHNEDYVRPLIQNYSPVRAYRPVLIINSKPYPA